MFPNGLPSQFSFVSTFRMSSRTRRETWDLLRVEDSFGKPQFGIRLDGKRKQVELYMPNYNNEIQTVTFRKDNAIKKVCIHATALLKPHPNQEKLLLQLKDRDREMECIVKEIT